ncbi:MAG: 2-oxoglutarate dehydrogenase, subunit, partial [Actinoallomurus sp.]|nr:2-oxoglutarate dehydrogenase, subunit [Actinoallomurus sp.]
MPTQSSRSSADLSTPDFGPNEWLVDELYQKYLEDPNSVDRAWWNFFADYQPDRPAKAPAGA